MLDLIDPGDGKKREAILLGDIFMPGRGPPNFPTTMLVRASMHNVSTLSACGFRVVTLSVVNGKMITHVSRVSGGDVSVSDPYVPSLSSGVIRP